MWGSMLIGDDYDLPFEVNGSDDIVAICKHLTQHPMFKSAPPQQGQSIMGAPDASQNSPTSSEGGGSLTPSESPKDTPDDQQSQQKKVQQMAEGLNGQQQQQPAAPGGLAKSIGWFDTFGKSAHDIVKDLKHARREHKMVKGEIDDLINVVRMMKQEEINNSLSSIEWANDRMDTIKSMGLNDRDLTALMRTHELRKTSLVRACMQWEDANNRINELSNLTGDWDNLEKQQWVQAHDDRDSAKKMWSKSLHILDSLTKSEMSWLTLASEELTNYGQMDSRTILSNLVTKGYATKKLTPAKLSGLMKTYGDEVGIMKGTKRNHWVISKQNGDLIIKDPWAYAAGFVDADGYITITKRGEPRVGLVATGERGRVHCEQLYKTLGCGVLQLDLKVHKSSKRSQHRLQFYSKKDVEKMLKGILPHLRLKKNQAESVLEYINTPKKGMLAKTRKGQLEKLVKWDNWQDTKGDELLEGWGVVADDVEAWRDPSLIRLGIQAEQMEAML